MIAGLRKIRLLSDSLVLVIVKSSKKLVNQTKNQLKGGLEKKRENCNAILKRIRCKYYLILKLRSLE